MKQELEQSMAIQEIAATHAHASATLKGYAAQRQRELRKLLNHGEPTQNTGKPSVSGWQQLAAKFEAVGAPVIRGGERLVN